MEEITTYPKIPTSNWYDIRKQFSKTLPPTVTPPCLSPIFIKFGKYRKCTKFNFSIKNVGANR